jgi:hypothetical protein
LFSENFDFLRDYRKAGARAAGSLSFDRRIECEQLRPLCDASDDTKPSVDEIDGALA